MIEAEPVIATQIITRARRAIGAAAGAAGMVAGTAQGQAVAIGRSGMKHGPGHRHSMVCQNRQYKRGKA